MTIAPTAPARRARSVRTNFILFQFGLQILLIVTLAIFSNIVLTNTVIDLWFARLNDASEHASHDVDHEIGYAFTSLNVANNSYLAELDEDLGDLQDLLASIIAAQPFVDELSVYTTSGESVSSFARQNAVLPLNASESDWFTAALGATEYISDVRLTSAGIPYLILASSRADGGLTAAILNMEGFNRALAETQLEQESDSYIVSRDGQVLAHVEYEWVEAQTNISGRDEWNTILARDNHVFQGEYTNFEGEPVFGASIEVPDSDWIVISEVPLAQLNEIRNQVRSVVLAIFIGYFVVASLLGQQIFNRLIFNPLQRLQEGEEKFAQGDLNVQVTPLRNDEFGRLTEVFNETVRRIREQTEDLRKARDEAVTANRIAQENSRLKSEFLSTMSHELRTPLNAIEGFTSIMLGNMGIELNPQARRMVERIGANSKRLLQLINDFLDLSRIESGRMELVSTPISPQTLAERVQKQVSVLAENKALDFTTEIDPQLPSTLYGDEEALVKITINLLGNAFKFTKAGSVKLSLRHCGDFWSIQVSDTGIGIPPHARDYIFDEFRQVDSTSKREYGGTGLGLAIVQKLTRLMGGQVQLESEVGQGSTFTVMIPLQTTPIVE